MTPHETELVALTDAQDDALMEALHRAVTGDPSLDDNHLRGVVSRIIAAHVIAAKAEALREVEEDLRSAFSGDEYEENAMSAAAEGEWSWFKWLAHSTVERHIRPVEKEADRG